MKRNTIAAAVLLAFVGMTPAIAADTSRSTGASGDNVLTNDKGAAASTGASQGDMLSGSGSASSTSAPASASTSASASASANFDNDSQLVLKAQEALKAKGQNIKADGIMGPKTRSAIRNYQGEEGLQVTGKLDSLTLIDMGIEQSGSVGSTPSK
jgi:peptidoglycan hydrolase-like protein with peptidoglycan-binding domain